jgi:hypothetical protein
MTAILGREAAFYGKEITWDELEKNGRSYFPEDKEPTSWDYVSPVQPDANGFYEGSIPVPGKYNPFKQG